jgi:hypothetical protein
MVLEEIITANANVYVSHQLEEKTQNKFKLKIFHVFTTYSETTLKTKVHFKSRVKLPADSGRLLVDFHSPCRRSDFHNSVAHKKIYSHLRVGEWLFATLNESLYKVI